MAEPTPHRVEFDADLAAWTVDLEPPGPAGIAAFQVSPRLQLLVDAADPDRIGAIVESDAPGHRVDAEESRALEAIFGSSVVDNLPGRRAGSRVRRNRSSPDDVPRVRAQLARLALAEDLTIDTTDEAVAAVAGAEAALLTETLRDDGHLEVDRPHSTTSAAQRLISEYPNIHEGLTTTARDEFVDLVLDLASSATSAVAVTLRLISEELTRETSGASAVAARHSPEAPIGRVDFDQLGPSTNVGHVRLDRRLFSPRLLDPSSRADVTWNRSDGDLIVRCRVARGAYLVGLGTHWVRAYRPDSRVVLALAPLELMRPTGAEHWAAARLHLGAHDLSTLAVDVTDAPHQRPPGALRRSIESASQIGSDAACRERAGAPNAIDCWEACADAWRTAGDHDREAIALARAAHLALTSQHDARGTALRTRLGRLAPTWAAGRLDPRQAPTPLVADLVLCDG